MQFRDFLKATRGLVDMLKILLFRMLPRGTQIEKVRAEINNDLLHNNAKVTKLESDKERRTIYAELDLPGEKENVRITLSKYHLIQEVGRNPLFEPGPIDVSPEWINELLKVLVQSDVIPKRIEVKRLLHQAFVKSIL